jgi:hypothetical protein
LQLNDSAFEVIGRDSLNLVIFRYQLTETPTPLWTAIFNRWAEPFKTHSFKNTNYIIIKLTSNQAKTLNTRTLIEKLIKSTNQDYDSSVNKNNTLVKVATRAAHPLPRGLVVVHNQLSHSIGLNGVSEYEDYLNKVITRVSNL